MTEQIVPLVNALTQRVEKVENSVEKIRQDIRGMETKSAVSETVLLRVEQALSKYCSTVDEIKETVGGLKYIEPSINRLNNKVDNLTDKLHESEEKNKVDTRTLVKNSVIAAVGGGTIVSIINLILSKAS
jgi:uncharacterized protein YoxC